MQAGSFDFLILIVVFLSLQAWWIIPIIKKKNKLNYRSDDLREEVKKLEKLYKK